MTGAKIKMVGKPGASWAKMHEKNGVFSYTAINREHAGRIMVHEIPVEA